MCQRCLPRLCSLVMLHGAHHVGGGGRKRRSYEQCAAEAQIMLDQWENTVVDDSLPATAALPDDRGLDGNRASPGFRMLPHVRPPSSPFCLSVAAAAAPSCSAHPTQLC